MTESNSAWYYDCDKFCSGRNIFWANPPFEDVKKVITKACLQPCGMVLVSRGWSKGNWRSLLEKVAVKTLEIPPHVPIFDHSLGKGLLPGRHLSTFVSLVDTFVNRVPHSELDPLLVQELEEDNLGWGPKELEKEVESYIGTREGQKKLLWTEFSA